MKMRPRPSVGIRNVAIQNAFARTCWRYSRLMTAKSFELHGYFSSSAVGAWSPDSWTHLMKIFSSSGSGSTGGGSGTRSRYECLMSLTVPSRSFCAAIEERDPLAEALGLLEDVRREDDRLALLLERGQEVLHEDDVDRVEAAERLVEDEDLRVVDDRPEELDLLLHALAQLLGLLLEPWAEVHRVDPRREALQRGRLVDALDRREEEELVDDLHLPVEAALLGQVADALLELLAHRLAEDADLALVGLRDVHDHPDRRRLAGAVRAEEAERDAVRNLEVELVHRRELAEALHDAVERDRGGHGMHFLLAGPGEICGWAGTKFRATAGRAPLNAFGAGTCTARRTSAMVRVPRFSRAPIAQLDQSV